MRCFLFHFIVMKPYWWKVTPPQDPLAVTNLRSHYLILLPDLLCISYFLLLTLVAVIKTSTRCVV